MGVGGIGPSEGHLGVSASTRNAQTARSVGGAAFEIGVTGGQIAAGAFGGPGAASAVGSLRGLGSAIGGGGGGFGGLSGGSTGTFGESASANQSVADALNAKTQSTLAEQAKLQEAGFSQQVALFQLQQAVNRDSEQFQSLTNAQKAKHDALTSAVNNLR